MGDAMLQSVLLVWLLGVLVGGQHPLLDHPQHQPLDFNKGRCRRSTLGAAHFRGRAPFLPSRVVSLFYFFFCYLSQLELCVLCANTEMRRGAQDKYKSCALVRRGGVRRSLTLALRRWHNVLVLTFHVRARDLRRESTYYIRNVRSRKEKNVVILCITSRHAWIQN